MRSDEFNYQVPALAAAGLRCVLYDRRGHGRSGLPAAGYDIDTMADDLAAVIGHFDLHEATLVATRWAPRKPSATSPATAIPASPGLIDWTTRMIVDTPLPVLLETLKVNADADMRANFRKSRSRP